MSVLQPEWVSFSVQGLNREENKDDVLHLETHDYYFFAVFDGVSSSKNARRAVDCVKDFLSASHSQYLDVGDLKKTSLSLVYNANRVLVSEITGGQTTITGVVVDKNSHEVHFFNLGDSRAYEVHSQFLKQLTTDHNLDTNRNVLTHCLGMISLEEEEIESLTVTWSSASRILLCTDGLYSFFEEQPVRFNNLFQKNLKQVGSSVTSEIAERNQDDATFVLIQFNV